jgi:hypothetical protein
MANTNGWGDGAANNTIGWGQGANNTIGWGDIHADSWAGLTDISGLPTTDSDAQAFITAAAITDPTQQAAINTLVVDLKGYSIWSKMHALYPFVGGTAAAHKFNLKNPLDTDAAFRGVFVGGWTHSNLGAIPNGINAYMDTKFKPNVGTLNSNAIGYYIRTVNSSGATDPVNMGAFDLISAASSLLNSASSLSGRLNGNLISGSITGGTGLFSISKTSLTTTNVYKNSTSVGSGNSGGSLSSNNIFIGTLDFQGTPYGSGYVNSQFAFAYMSDGLTDTEAANFYTAVQAFQTTLGRSIGTQTVSDADAQAFVTAADIQDQVEANAINNLVIGMKADGLWTKMKALYPFVGGDATKHSWNLKNTAQFQISWNGGVTHSSNGVQFGGVNGYGDTGLNAASVLSQDSTHLSFYSRTDITANSVEMGINASARQLYLLYRYGSSAFKAMNRTQAGAGSLYSPTNSLLIANRPSSTTEKYYHKGTLVDTLTVSSTGTISAEIYIGGYNNTVVPTSREYSSKQCAFASIGDGLTDTEAANFYTAVQNFNTALARQV